MKPWAPVADPRRRSADVNPPRCVSMWASERPLGLFGSMTEALRDPGVEELHTGRLTPRSYSLGAGELRRLLSDASLREVVVESVELDAVWRNAEDAVARR